MRTKATCSISILMLAVTAMDSRSAPADSLAVRKCQAYVQGRIDVLDAELHKGTHPNNARELLTRREKLRTQLRACTKNPNAYKKDI